MGFGEFLEQHLGEIQYGFTHDENGDRLTFQIVKYGEGLPFEGAVTYTTLGLSNEVLHSRQSGKNIRQELVFVAPSNYSDRNIPGILQRVASMAISSRHAWLRGDVIGPYGTMLVDSEMEGLYVAPPVYFPDDFATYTEENGKQIVLAWLIPVTPSEIHFVNQNGWERFEDLLETTNPDLIDFNRKSIVS